MKIYLKNKIVLRSIIKRFYESRFIKLRNEGKKIKKSDVMSWFQEMTTFLKSKEVSKELTQPTFNEWVDKGYKQFKHNRWFFAVDYIQIQDGEGRWVTVDCHHESKNHNDDMVNEWKNFPEIQAILDLEQRMDNL